ncbi:unnamed protein product [Cuscuta epithymum]|uniref:Retrovirus-related Pol polyprotein from transposon RE1 n=1 Tax=Cuscuta epithymum TaxID=186058 RepID=A0AAV0CZR0_9ASTE|nr:unnamed protein product [Cuscuta epithymum]
MSLSTTHQCYSMTTTPTTNNCRIRPLFHRVLLQPCLKCLPPHPSLSWNCSSPQLKHLLVAQHFAMKDLGDLHYFLGVQAVRSSKVSQFMHAPRTTHLFAVKRIFRYLHGTLDHGLWLQPTSQATCVIAYSDVDWAGCPDTSRSTTGFDVFLGSNLVSWKSKKQPTVSKSSTEAEYRAVAYTVQDTLHIRSVLFELGFPVTTLVQLFCDNISASYLTANPVQHARSKHIQIDYHFVWERVAHGDLVLKYITTQLQLADIFTKSLSSRQFQFLKDNSRVVSPAQFEGV